MLPKRTWSARTSTPFGSTHEQLFSAAALVADCRLRQQAWSGWKQVAARAAAASKATAILGPSESEVAPEREEMLRQWISGEAARWSQANPEVAEILLSAVRSLPSSVQGGEEE